MEQERNIIGAVTGVLFSGMIDFLAPLKWFALLGLILIIADLRFGVRAAKARGEKIRFSRAGRRTINKLVDYACWVFLAAALDKAFLPFSIPLLPGLVLLAVYGFEVNSCYSNYFEARGKKVKIDILKLFRKKMDIIEIKEEEEIYNENPD
jgi:uncharacterized membrane protein YfcA